MAGTSLAGARVLVVLAHPDDESLACGGTLALLARERADVHLLCVTRGECGHVTGIGRHEGDRLAVTRIGELREACAILGLTSHEVLAFRDGELMTSGQGALIDVLEVRLRSWRPTVVITFGRDGLYWHPDHIAVGERVRSAVARCADDVPVAAYGVTMPPGTMTALAAAIEAGTGGVERAFWGVPPEVFGFAARAATRVIDVSAVLGAKVTAIRAHRSQLAAANPLAHLTLACADPLATEHFSLLETSPLHRSVLDRLSVELQE